MLLFAGRTYPCGFPRPTSHWLRCLWLRTNFLKLGDSLLGEVLKTCEIYPQINKLRWERRVTKQWMEQGGEHERACETELFQFPVAHCCRALVFFPPSFGKSNWKISCLHRSPITISDVTWRSIQVNGNNCPSAQPPSSLIAFSRIALKRSFDLDPGVLRQDHSFLASLGQRRERDFFLCPLTARFMRQPDVSWSALYWYATRLSMKA